MKEWIPTITFSLVALLCLPVLHAIREKTPDLFGKFHQPPYVSQINTVATFEEEGRSFSIALVNINGSCVAVVLNGTGTAAAPALCPWEAK